MRTREPLASAALFLLISALPFSRGVAQTPPLGIPAAGGCDRQCLTQIVDSYLDAMVAKEPLHLQWAAKAKYTENGMKLNVGEGLWATASGLGKYQQHFIDTIGGQAGWMGVVLENGAPVILGLRLKVASHRILEAEHIVARSGDGAARLEAIGSPPAIFGETLVPVERAPRAQLIAAANAYFDGIERSSGKMVPFAQTCVRIENGRQTAPAVNTGAGEFGSRLAGMSCSEQFDTGIFSYITEVRERRFEVVDEDKGDVLAFVIFSHPGNVLYAQLPGQPRLEMSAAAKKPFDTQLAEVFKVKSGRIHQIEAVINSAAFGISSGWESQGVSE